MPLVDGILVCDVMTGLRQFPTGSVSCVVTSPPYLGLRDYGIEPTDWPAVSFRPMADLPEVEVPAATCCLGHEDSPLAYVAHLVHVGRELRRVLCKTGTLWLNLADSYAGSWGAQSRGHEGSERTSTLHGGSLLHARKLKAYAKPLEGAGSLKRTPGLKRKDLVGAPWRVALALQADGWWLRSDIVWSKSNPVPESAADRPVRAHEYLFLLSPSKRYYYDRQAIVEPASEREVRRWLRATREEPYNVRRTEAGNGQVAPGRHGCMVSPAARRELALRGTRNARTVWEIPTSPCPFDHPAAFPEALPKRCILAGCPAGGIVLDPFCGSGTTLAVAKALGRHFLGIDFSEINACMAQERVSGVTPTLFGGGE